MQVADKQISPWYSGIFLFIPLIGGMIACYYAIKKKDKGYFKNIFLYKFDNVTSIGLLLTLVMIFLFQGKLFLGNPLRIILIAVPLIIQTFLIFAVAYVSCRLLKLPYNISVPAGMIGASNFFEISAAIAIALFGTASSAALAAAVGALMEIPVMLFLVRNENNTKG